MTTRRDHRQTHVRPRPPSTGRPAPVKVKPRSPGPGRLSARQPIKRSRGVPMVFRFALVAAVLALSAGVLYVGVNGFGIVAGGIGSTLGGFVSRCHLDAIAAAGRLGHQRPASLGAADEPYTPEATADLVVTVPAGLAGSPDHRIRVYLALPEQPPTAIQESPIATAPKTIIPVTLEKGINDFTVSIVGPAGESEMSLRSPATSWTRRRPKITITSPKNNAVVNGKAVTLKGKTQARTTLLARNDASGSSIAGTAGADGTFTLSLALSPGVNTITIVGTDPAGNVTETSLKVKRGSGKLTAKLTASTYQIKRSRLPEPITLTATVTDPDGKPLADADVTFTLSIPGIPTVTIDGKTERERQGVVQHDDPEGRRHRPGERDRAGDEQGARLDRGLHGHLDRQVDRRRGTPRRAASPARQRTAFAATIRACRCGAVRIAGHPRPRRPGAGSADDPAPRAPPVRTSADPLPPSSATAGSIVSGVRCAATRSGPAGRPPPSRSRSCRAVPSGACRRRSTRSMMEPLFGSSNSSRSAAAPAKGAPEGERRAPPQPRPSRALAPAEPAAPVSPGEPRWSLWGDAEV